MITIDNKTYRNIQEQVEKNKKDIAAWSSIELTLNNFGIKVLGRVDYVSDIPEATFEYGDAYLVGLNEPFNVYIYTRTGSDEGMFINMGPLNIVGQQGPEGPQGPAGKDGYAPVVRYGDGLPVVEPTDKAGYIYIDQQTSRLYAFKDGYGWNFVINMQGPKGDKGNQGIQGATGTTLSIVGKLSSPTLLPTNFASGAIPKNSAYLVDVNGANHLYIILGNQSDYSTWYWQDAGDFNLGSVIYKNSAFQASINITDSYNTNTGAVVTDTATNNMNSALQDKIDSKVDYTEFENELLTKADADNAVTPTELTNAINSAKNELNGNIDTVNSNLTGLINGKQDKLNASQTSAVNSGINAVLVNRINTNRTNISSISEKIPAQASSSNQLADKDFVNSSLNSIAAYYITKNAAGDSFATKAELDAATTFYSGGVERVPTRNDYCIVIKDESHNNATTRYIYNNNWEYQYTVNQTAFTAEQIAAINSGITETLVSSFIQKPTLDMIYPVGSIYMSVNSVNPSTLFGGAWEQIKDRFLLSCGNTYANGATGGEATHTLTVNEMPSHKHEFAVNQPEMGGRVLYNGPAYVTNIAVNNPAYSNGDYLQYIGLTGSDAPHNNMPPYLAVYMWRRTA